MAEAYGAISNREQSTKDFVKTLELNPKNYDAAERLRQVKQQ
jgi:hypothetical protein